MDFYRLGSIFLDISIGVLLLSALIRLALVLTYFKRNGSRVLTESQRKSLRKIIIPVAVTGLLFGVASIIALLCA